MIELLAFVCVLTTKWLALIIIMNQINHTFERNEQYLTIFEETVIDNSYLHKLHINNQACILEVEGIVAKIY